MPWYSMTDFRPDSTSDGKTLYDPTGGTGVTQWTVKNVGDITIYMSEVDSRPHQPSPVTSGYPIKPGESLTLPPNAHVAGTNNFHVPAFGTATDEGSSYLIGFCAEV